MALETVPWKGKALSNLKLCWARDWKLYSETGGRGFRREEEGKRGKKSCCFVSDGRNTCALLETLFLIWGLEKRKNIFKDIEERKKKDKKTSYC